MSGADLANVINEAALLTARENGTIITGAALEVHVAVADQILVADGRRGRLVQRQRLVDVERHQDPPAVVHQLQLGHLADLDATGPDELALP